MELLKDSKRDRARRQTAYKLIGFGTVAIGTIVGFTLEVNNTDAQASYDRQYTSHDSCLDGTPFDAANGASVINRGSTLQIVPEAANSYHPATLLLTIHGHGLKAPTFGAADPDTAEFIAVQPNCPETPLDPAP